MPQLKSGAGADRGFDQGPGYSNPRSKSGRRETPGPDAERPLLKTKVSKRVRVETQYTGLISVRKAA